MSLPGKLCIGIIEEDNPQKSYFRFKPLLIADDGVFTAYDEYADYPENGCIRIVPDKNESSRFKARMRRMGLYCMVDLREHPDDNDKIRPNKNYHGDETEANAYIIYSDVVRELPEGTLAQVIAQDVPGDSSQLALNVPAPSSPRVVFSGFEPFATLWSHAPVPNTDGTAFTRTDVVPGSDAYTRISVNGFGDQVLDLIVAKPDTLLYSVEPAAPAAPAPVVQASPAPQTAPAAQLATAQPQQPEPEAPAAPAQAATKPWIHHDDSVLPQPIDPSLPPREQAMALQTGINPRRGRSLQEIIDDKWRRSRIDQLGHPIPGEASAQPVSSPIDNALEAVNAAWALENARTVLAQALAGIAGLDSAISASADKAAAEQRAAKQAEYEAEKENLNAEIERCRSEREKLQSEMFHELEIKHTAELEEHADKIRQLEASEEVLKQRADEAKLIVQEAEHAIAQLTDEKLTARLSEYAVSSRAADILTALSNGNLKTASKPEVTPVCCANVPSLAKRVRSHFCANGVHITDDEAINLLACLALGDKIIISGPTGSGKTTTVRLLTEALGLTNAKRCVTYAPVKDNAYTPDLECDCEYPGAVIADDINAAAYSMDHIVSDFEPLNDIKLLMTAQDSTFGAPMGLRLLDRAFLVRLAPEKADSCWTGPGKTAPAPDGCVTAAALKKLFCPEARHISAQVSARLAALRKELSAHRVTISRRTLDAMWQYCAAVTPYMSLAPMDVFDLVFAQRALPAIIASAGPEALIALPGLLKDMPRSLALLKEPLAIDI